jgi:hypothetical protein
MSLHRFMRNIPAQLKRPRGTLIALLKSGKQNRLIFPISISVSDLILGY